ncbi:retrovirus-related Pol polyprotein from type-1 retrotransposable element R1 [Bemisia tabaci]|uniref:retrovirus-related Pol polyprotein from type-1 retrotransposable element R1 n=2 Tax=Bemisia tabaci TaxID=7038 RepID=UPI003B28C462
MPLRNLITADLTAVKVNVKREGEDRAREFILASSYLPYELEPPTAELQRLVDYATRGRSRLIVGTDANSHHVAWGSTDTNGRGNQLLEFISSFNLNVLNLGNEPTFVTRNRSEVIDITIASSNAEDWVKDWRVAKELVSLSDHRYITFKLNVEAKSTYFYRNPRRTNWDLYRKELVRRLGEVELRYGNIQELNAAALALEGVITSAYHNSCPEIKRREPTLEWWSPKLGELRQETRKLWNKARRDGSWDEYYTSLNAYNRELRRAKKESWRKFCEEIDTYSDGAKLMRLLAKDPAFKGGNLMKPDGSLTETEAETLEVLLQTHFPECEPLQDENSNEARETQTFVRRTGRLDWHEARETVTVNRLKWAVKSFKPYKAPGPDGILPALLQQGAEILQPALIRILRASLAFGYIPQGWREVRVVFLPKHGRKNFDQAKAYRPICLSSFITKTLERLVDRRMCEGLLRVAPLHSHQHAYQIGKSTETALNSLVEQIERAMKSKEVALAVFLDIEGAFDNTSIDAILNSARTKGLNNTTYRWVEALLRGRHVNADLFGESRRVRATRGCPQGGVISPKLWNLVADELLVRLNEAGYYAQAYADDFVILIRGKHCNDLSDLMSGALRIVEEWCRDKNLRVNPTKTTLVPFTRKYNLGNIQAPSIFGSEIKVADTVKYLGVYLDKRMNWNQHLEHIINRAKRAMNLARRSVGKRWGLKPAITKWVYTSIVRPIITYAACIWWEKTEQKGARNKLDSLQRLACLYTTGAVRTTPTAAMEVMLGLPPLHLAVKGEAVAGAFRLKTNSLDGKLRPRHQSLCESPSFPPALHMVSDQMKTTYNFDIPYRLRISEGEGNQKMVDDALAASEVSYFTDGSKSGDKTGAAVYGNKNCKLKASLGRSTTVNQAELYAIMMAANNAIDKGWRDKRITFFSDSQATLKAVSNFKVNSKLTMEGIQRLTRLANDNHVTLVWVRGHTGVRGNETADRLAKEASEENYIGPEPVFGLTKKGFRTTVRDWVMEEANKEWQNAEGMRHSKQMLEGYSRKMTANLLHRSREQLGILSGLLTGHNLLRKHMHRMGIFKDEPKCRLCEVEEETAEHIIFDCEALEKKRQDIRGDNSWDDCLAPELVAGTLLQLVEGEGFWD